MRYNMFRGRTMQHINKRTPETKTVPRFTTNSYRYETHTCPVCPVYIKPTEYNIKTKTNNYPKIREQKNNVDFKRQLQEAIDEGFSMLGESAKKAIYFHLEKTYRINRQDIPVRIEEFINAIEQLFGTGAKILEIQIMKCLFKKFNFKLTNYAEKKFTFKEYIAALKRERDTIKINTTQRIN